MIPRKLRKVGDSLVITLPSGLLEELNWKERDLIDIEIKDGRLVLYNKQGRLLL